MFYNRRSSRRAARWFSLACVLLLSCCTGARSSVEVSPTASSARANSAVTPVRTSDSEHKTVNTAGTQAAAAIQPVNAAPAAVSSRPVDPDAEVYAEAYSGFYEVLGERPKSIDPFGNFLIRSVQGTSVSGAVIPNEGKVFEFVTATLDAGRLSFSTKEVNGISYSFDGGFTEAPPFTSGKKIAVAEGTLTKLQKGKSVATADLKFFYDEGGGE